MLACIAADTGHAPTRHRRDRRHHRTNGRADRQGSRASWVRDQEPRRTSQPLRGPWRVPAPPPTAPPPHRRRSDPVPTSARLKRAGVAPSRSGAGFRLGECRSGTADQVPLMRCTRPAASSLRRASRSSGSGTSSTPIRSFTDRPVGCGRGLHIRLGVAAAGHSEWRLMARYVLPVAMRGVRSELAGRERSPPRSPRRMC